MPQRPDDEKGQAAEAGADGGARPDQPGAQPTVSVVIPAYNAADTIGRALDSVYAQTYDNIVEVIVVDDGSADATAEIVGEKYPRTILLRQENAGVSVARNAGVDRATGELIAFLDADDEWLPEKTERHVAVMQDHPGLALCMCAGVPSHARASLAEAGEAVLRQITFRDAATWTKGLLRGCSVWLIRRDVIRRVRFDPRFRRGQDLELIGRLAGLGYGVAFYSRPLNIYYGTRERRLRVGISEASAERSLLLADTRYGSESGQGHGWLTSGEMNDLWALQHRTAADTLCLLGDDGAAGDVARRALSTGHGTPRTRARLWLLARAPGAYGWLRRTFFRVRGR
jgi:GT2 family glycosyltransferase